jgi:uncharacterized repeat protein (TIGR01451 family)
MMKRSAGRAALAALVTVAVFPPLARAGTTVAVADVGIVKTQKSPNPIHPGDVVTYSITVSNAGPDSAFNVQWTDTTPPGTTLDEFTPPAGVSCSIPTFGTAGTIACTLTAPLASGASAGPYDIEIAVPNGASGAIVNVAQVTTASEDDNPDNDSSEADTPIAAITSVPAASVGALAALGAAVAVAGLLLLRR